MTEGPNVEGQSVQTRCVETRSVYVSITGLRLKRRWDFLRFFWYAIRSMRQVRRAQGILNVEAKTIDGVHHTRTVWESEAHMRRFLYRGAHRQAIGAFAHIATGKTFGFETKEVPGWDDVHALWRSRGREYTALG